MAREADAMEKINSPQKVIQLSPEEMSKLIKAPGIKVKRYLLTQAESENLEATAKKKIKKENEEEDEDYKKVSRGGASFGLGMVVFSGGEGAIVTFAIIGVILVIAWIVAFPVMIFEALANREDYNTFQFLSLNYSRFSLSGLHREAQLEGLRYSVFLTAEESLDGRNYGVALEAGHYDYYTHGEYWMAGPSFMYGWGIGKRNAFWKLDLLAGSTFDSQFGIFSKADGSINFEVSPDLSLGAGIGAVYVDVKGYSTQLSSSHNLGFLYGLSLNYHF